MMFVFLFVALGLILGAIALLAVVTTGGDLVRRWRGADRDSTVIADSTVEFEADVGKPPPGP